MPRNATLDYARLVAAVGIVWFHAGAPGAAVGYAALPFFLILIVFLAYPAAERTAFPAYARKRAERLLRPFCVWSCIYGSLKLLEVALTGRTFAEEFDWYMLLTGPALHLWFLPFAFAICLLMHPLARRHLKGTSLVVTLVMLQAAVLGCLWLAGSGPFPIPFSQWIFALPSALTGMAFATLNASRRSGYHVLALITVALAGCTLLGDYGSGAPQLMIATIALWLCLALPLRQSTVSDLAARCSLTVYLVHPLVLSILERTIAPQGIWRAALAALLSIIVALALIALDARRLPLNRVLKRP